MLSEPFSPEWWLTKLSSSLNSRNAGSGWTTVAKVRSNKRPGLQLLDDHLRGDPPLPTAASGWRDGMREFLRLSRTNYAELVVDSVVERMLPLGFRTGVDSDPNGDDIARRVYAANELDLRFADVACGMLALADSYMIVGPPDGDGMPLITAEDAREVITAEDPATGRTLAGLKQFKDEWTGDTWSYLYLPGVLQVTKSQGGAAPEWDDDLSQAYPAGFQELLPVVRFQNRRGVGEYEPHLNVLDRINDTLFERVVIAKYQAFRQRAAIGLPLEDEHGKEIDYSDVFNADPGAIWQMPEGSQMWESAPGNLDPLRGAIKDDVQALAAVTRTPLHYITPDAANGSAEGASLMREGHVYKVEDRRRRADRALAKVMALAFRYMGEDARADASTITTIWQPAERFSLSERYDAAVKAKAAGEPWPSIAQNILQYSPDQQAWIDRMRADDALLAAVATPEELAQATTGARPAPAQPQPEPRAEPAA